MDASAAAVALIVAGLLPPLTLVALLIVERRFPARELPRVEGWTKKGIVFFFVTGFFQMSMPVLVGVPVSRITPFHFATLGLVPCVALLLVSVEATVYAIHRTMHAIPWLWRWTHQLHHSAERVDVAGALYFHPLDVVIQSALTALPAALFDVGVVPAATAGYVFFFIAVFQHVNVKTPRWLGWIVIRPEQHAMHHQRGVHDHNYGNFAFMDLLFGTFRNPEGFVAKAGFYDGASARLGEMLRGRDVSSPS